MSLPKIDSCSGSREDKTHFQWRPAMTIKIVRATMNALWPAVYFVLLFLMGCHPPGHH